ncbi:hypothetical protein Adt_18371 [Abeliophyllum distichum]|uniref:Uncharacterized protein n=1 Tax=Abeliophyllum distichum TaxID=126358 RepID=A0ABD1TJ68_9LAMI
MLVDSVCKWKGSFSQCTIEKGWGRKRTDVGVPEMRRSLDKKDAPAARTLDEELRCSATEASMDRSRITVEELEDLRLSYDIPSSVTLMAPGPEERADDPPEGFVTIYEPAMQQGLRLPMHPFFRVGIMFLLDQVRNGEQPLTVPTRCTTGRRDCGKPPIPKRNQGELRSKWGKVRTLSSDFRFKGVHVLRLARPASGEGSSAQASRHEASGPLQEVRDATPSSTIPPPRPEVDANVHQSPSSSSNLDINSTTLRDKGKKVVEGTEEAPAQKRKAPAATEGLMRDTRKARRTKEGRRSSPSLDGKPDGPGTLLSVHRYWTPSWETVVEEVTVLERLQLVEVNLVRGLVLAKDIFSAFVSFDVEEAKSKKLAEDLKAMGLEKAQLESNKRAFQFKLDLVVTKEADMKAKYEIELKAAKECLKQARDQRRTAVVSQKCAEEAQKLAEDRTLVAETPLAAANSSLEAATADNERSLTAAKLELEKVRTERADAEAKVVEAYQDAFVDTSEYQDLAQHLMTVGGEQLVERIMEAHPEWDLSFLPKAPTEARTSEADPGDTRGGDKGPSCADP